MANGATFDTHEAVKRLTARGAGEELAEAIVETVRDSRETVATFPQLKAELAALETRMTNRLHVVAAGIVAATAALDKLW